MSLEDGKGRSATPLEQEVSPEWQEAIREGITNAIENFSLFYYPEDEAEDPVETPVNLAPYTITEGVDERSFVDLSAQEREYVKAEMFGQLGIDRRNPELLGRYSFLPFIEELDTVRTNREGLVQIFNTDSEEGITLHEITYPDEKVDYFLATEDYRFPSKE